MAADANVKMKKKSQVMSSGNSRNGLNKLPIRLNERLMDFQKEGVKFALAKNGRCLIADEMGLGKTLQALSTAYLFKEHWPLLIIVPSSLKYPWIDEIEKWMPEINPVDINLIQNGSDVSEIPHALMTIVTYGLLRSPASKVLREALMTQEFRVVIVDESHYIKNRLSATSKYLVPLLCQAEHKMLLTGTPALARPAELFPQLEALCPGEFGNWSQYAKRYCDAHWQYFGHQKRWNTEGASNLEELQELLKRHVMIRRLKKDVLTQLPPKQRQKIAFQLKDSVIKKELDAQFENLEVLLGRRQLDMIKFLTVADARASQEAASFFEVNKQLSELFRTTSKAKLGPVKEYVKMLCDNQGLKFIVFAYHRIMLDAVSEQLHDEKIDFIRIDGSTDQQDRPRLVHKFQADVSTRVAVLSIKAAGVGLTLTAAKLVVFAELDWTPGNLEQAEDRAHRIGQTDTVHIHYLVARGTLDEWVWSALARKTTVITTTLNGEKQVLRMDEGNQGQISVLSNADAWIPPSPSEQKQDIAAFFKANQLPKNQKTLMHFFNKKGHKRKKSGQQEEEEETVNDENEISPLIRKRTRKDSSKTPKKCKNNTKKNFPLFDNCTETNGLKEKQADFVLLDSDSDDNSEHFKTPKKVRTAPVHEMSSDSDDDRQGRVAEQSDKKQTTVIHNTPQKTLDSNGPESPSSGNVPDELPTITFSRKKKKVPTATLR